MQHRARLAERALARLAESEPQIRVRAIAANTGSVAQHVADGTVEIGLGFASAATPGVRLEAIAHVPAVAAVAADDPVAARESVALAELAGRRFAQVDAHDGPGYNDAVRELCREAGFEPALADQASGPMAWETAVRGGDCVGLTTRVSAASTVRGIRTIELEEQALFRIDLLTPETAEGRLSAAARSFAEAARAVSGPVIRAAS